MSPMAQNKKAITRQSAANGAFKRGARHGSVL